MYWRINCTEHLVLDLQTQPRAAASQSSATPAGGGDAAASRDSSAGAIRPGRRPRSITYSADSRPAAGNGTAKRPAHVDVPGSHDAKVVQWASSPDGLLLAGIARQGVYLWLAKPFVLLSSLVYDATDAFGELVDIIWGDPEGAAAERGGSEANACGTLFAVLSGGFIYEIAVYRRDTPVLEYQFAVLHYFGRGPGEGDGIRGFGIIQKRTYRLPESGPAARATAAAPAADHRFAVVATRSHVYRLTWTGALISSTPVAEIHDNPLAEICQLVCLHGSSASSSRDGGSGEDSSVGQNSGPFLELYMFTDGAIRILSGGQAVDVQPLDGAGSLYKATAISYSAASRMVAVGTSAGEIMLCAVAGKRLDTLSRLAFDHDKDARVTALAWTPDGSAVACGYSTGHVVVRSVLGYELNVTRLCSQKIPACPAPAPFALAWVPGATRLYVFSSCVDAAGAPCGQQGDVLLFARAALGTVACEGNSKRVCLFSDEKVFLYLGGLEAHGAASQQPELQWHAAHIPPGYMANNWPIRYVAADDGGQHIAVAGRHGVAHYSLATLRWRLFRSQQQEASLTCVGGLLWYQEYLVVACISHEHGDSPQVMFFPRSRPLDTASDVQTVALESPAVAMGCHNSTLLVLCRSGMLYQYAIFDDMDFIQVSFRRAVDLGSAGVDPLRVRSLQWVPSALFEHRPSFLVHEGTVLSVVEECAAEPDASSPRPPARASVVSDRAEFAITSGVNFGNMHSTVWWFNGRELQASLISLEDFMDGGTGPLTGPARQRMMRIHPEFYPAAISADRGMAVGLDQDWTLEDHMVVGLAKLPVRAKLYLHNILDRLLSDGAEQDALMYAACFEHLEFFAHAMEMLLHEVLVREIDGAGATDDARDAQSTDAAVLPRVFRLLENFASFYEIVVHCARKTEAAFWPHLFACVGGPGRLFRQCLATGRLETATQCLIILQTLEPASVSEGNILALLGRTVDAQNSALTNEILRFLTMAAESDDAVHRLLARLRGGGGGNDDEPAATAAPPPQLG
ncbi:WD40 repeat protein [Coemansia biformis]|uniref:WD40 repeat protein n=1 Tax=Coemansia biformis TaxID=1286918 RepID=A0A9W8CY64_9FUNG|nr:WD40 repeat protein [Coemansia biformis]